MRGAKSSLSFDQAFNFFIVLSARMAYMLVLPDTAALCKCVLALIGQGAVAQSDVANHTTGPCPIRAEMHLISIIQVVNWHLDTRINQVGLGFVPL